MKDDDQNDIDNDIKTLSENGNDHTRFFFSANSEIVVCRKIDRDQRTEDRIYLQIFNGKPYRFLAGSGRDQHYERSGIEVGSGRQDAGKKDNELHGKRKYSGSFFAFT